MAVFSDGSLYSVILRSRANAFAAWALLNVKHEDTGEYATPRTPTIHTASTSLELTIEYACAAISKLDLTKEEQEQEALELEVLRTCGLIRGVS